MMHAEKRISLFRVKKRAIYMLVPDYNLILSLSSFATLDFEFCDFYYYYYWCSVFSFIIIIFSHSHSCSSFTYLLAFGGLMCLSIVNDIKNIPIPLLAYNIKIFMRQIKR